MKKITYLAIITFVLAGCNDDFYTEGRVETVSVTEITKQTAVLNGKIEVAHEGSKAQTEIKSRGFMIGTSSNDMNIRVNDKINGKGNFSCNATNLTPNTKYYVRAYAGINAGGGNDNYNNMFYGNIVEFTTDTGYVAPPPPPSEYIALPAAGIAVQKSDLSNGVNWNSAHLLCAGSIVGEYNDWRLPTIDELSVLYTNRTVIGGFSTGWYWSSTEYNSSYGYALHFSSDDYDYQHKNNSYSVRCVRTLP
jgi:hypothetical protein